MESIDDIPCLISTQKTLVDFLSHESNAPINPNISVLKNAESSLHWTLPNYGLGVMETTNHLLEKIAPALNQASLSPNYYGFVTGGLSPAARVADSVVSFYDQNVQVHLPDQTIATTVEDRALVLLMDLLQFDSKNWPGRTFTTGATSSNVLGLACAREHVINLAVKRRRQASDGQSTETLETVGESGLNAACRAAGIDEVQILTTFPHSSLKKASSVLGFGRSSVQDVGKVQDFLAFDLEKTEAMLKRKNTSSILVISCGEVNTGFFATHSVKEVEALRSLCDEYGAWIHVDAAFGLFARLLERSPGFENIYSGTVGLELADSITGDGHKLLNVPYDCGFFFCRHENLAQQVFQNPSAAYLSSGDASPEAIPSPLNVGMENSRRFRGLPVYATLISYGRIGYREMLERQIRLARGVAAYLLQHPAFELLPIRTAKHANIEPEIFIVVLFRAKDPMLNLELVQRINTTSKIYVSGTIWNYQAASRIAVSNWQADLERDLKIIKSVLEKILDDWIREHPIT